MTRDFFTLRLFGVSAPWGHNGEGLLPQPARTHRLAREARRNKADVGVFFEASRRLFEVFASHVGFALAPLRANQVTPRKGGVGTAIFSRRTVEPLDDEVLRIRVPRSLRALKMPVRLFSAAEVRAFFVVIGAHSPTRRAASERTRRRVNRALISYGGRVARTLRVPVFVIVDRNDGSAPEWLAAGWVIVAQHGVDFILAFFPDDVEGRPTGVAGFGWAIEEGIGGVITDHGAALLASVRIFTLDEAAETPRMVLPPPRRRKRR